ncbi:uncharacterized protein lcorl isoform X2 [Erpetoichthys calabaricus]|nr:uncharacterized protein lcorl isoform X2 [Erpetoichthys calabaricus]
MAAQCRSSKCTAERKGFRRELDSWRHKLIRCVGFESILEGIYGPRLLRDISIFDDCEPNEVNDWSFDENCSFCNLQIEKINDYIPPLGSLQSTSDESPSQGQSNTEQIQCQADKFLHAIFRKKDFPQNCDPTIPLVAQELMKKMIRQFAIEYASKSHQIQDTRNGLCVHLDSAANSLQQPHDQDGPLDLTINRNQISAVQADGVLDLSKKTSATSSLSTSTTAVSDSNFILSYKLPIEVAPEPHLESPDEKLEVRRTALEVILASLCPFHKHLLYSILLFMHEDYNVSHYLDCHRCFSCQNLHCYHLVNQVNNDSFNFKESKMTDRCCTHYGRLNPHSKPPLCICEKKMHCVSCQNKPITCINRAAGHRGCDMFDNHRCHCSCQHFEDTVTTPSLAVNLNCCCKSGSSFSLSVGGSTFNRACSPSPPPLSPVANESSEKSDHGITCPILEYASGIINNQPPSLLPQETEVSEKIFPNKYEKKRRNLEKDMLDHQLQTSENDSIKYTPNSGNQLEQTESGALINDLMERINEKLKTIEPLEKQCNSSSVSMVEYLEEKNDKHLGEIITSILHKNNGNNDYNLGELLNQHEKSVENKTIQTRFRRKQETLSAMHQPPDSPSLRRKTLQIKREIACLDQSFFATSLVEKNVKKCIQPEHKSFLPHSIEVAPAVAEFKNDFEDRDAKYIKTLENKQVPSSQIQKDDLFTNHHNSLAEKTQELHSVQKVADVLKPNVDPELGELLDVPKKSQNLYGSESEEKDNVVNACSPSRFEQFNNSHRTKRNIIPPERFSMYVTEPRKMYFAACFSESIFMKSSAKPKKICRKVFESPASSPPVNTNPADPKIQTDNHENENRSPYRLTQELISNNVPLCNNQTNPESPEAPITDISNDTKDSKELYSQDTKRHNSHKVKQLTIEVVTDTSVILRSPDNNSDDDSCYSVNRDEYTTRRRKPVSQSDLRLVCEARENTVTSYTSPIRLMYLSKINDKDGIKYTITPSFSNPIINDSCVVNTEINNSLQNKHLDKEPKSPKSTESNSSGNNIDKDIHACNTKTTSWDLDCDSSKYENSGESQLCMKESLKRRPGRPKKLGPQIEKQVKRPIGRPPKRKADCSYIPPTKNDTLDNMTTSACPSDGKEECTNKNIKVTVVYGRSRRIKRFVCEGSEFFRKVHHERPSNTGFHSVLHEEETGTLDANLKENSNNVANKEPGDNRFEFIRPVKDKECAPPPNSNSKQLNQKITAAMRKPGRPAKIKISGISVTVNAISPKQRKVSLSSELPKLCDTTSNLAEQIFPVSNENTNEDDNITVSKSTNVHQPENKLNKVNKPLLPLRHSDRIRKPSIHFLHSVASCSMFTHRSALKQKTQKLSFDSSKNNIDRVEVTNLTNNRKCSESNTRSVERNFTEHKESVKKNLTENADVNSKYEFCAESIFSTKEVLKWWPTSASNDTLQEELNQRFEQISNSWLSTGAQKRQNERVSQVKSKPELDGNPKSVVRMLFRKHCDVDKLCVWFMQSTETQTLSIVRKANARNPLEILHYPGKRTIDQADIVRNSQTDRIRKHVKKFAVASPLSPPAHFQNQEKVDYARNLKVKKQLYSCLDSVALLTLGDRKLRHRKHDICKAVDDHWKRKNKISYKTRLLNGLNREHLSNVPVILKSPNTNICERNLHFVRTKFSEETQSHSFGMLSHDGEKKNPDLHLDQNFAKELLESEEKMLCKKWSPETLKECRVFLTKLSPLEGTDHALNLGIQYKTTILCKSSKDESTQPKCTIDEHSFCTVKLYDVLSRSTNVLSSTTLMDKKRFKKQSECRLNVASHGTRHSPRLKPETLIANTVKDVYEDTNGITQSRKTSVMTRKRSRLATCLNKTAKKRRQSFTSSPSGRNYSHFVLEKSSITG